MDPSREARIALACHDTEVELWAKGYTADQASACVKTARKWAQGVSGQLSAPIRDQAYEELLMKRLGDAEHWLERTREGVARG